MAVVPAVDAERASARESPRSPASVHRACQPTSPSQPASASPETGGGAISPTIAERGTLSFPFLARCLCSVESWAKTTSTTTRSVHIPTTHTPHTPVVRHPMLLAGLRPLGNIFRAAPAGPIASSSRAALPTPSPVAQQVRFRSQLAPRKVKYRKSFKGKPTVRTCTTRHARRGRMGCTASPHAAARRRAVSCVPCEDL